MNKPDWFKFFPLRWLNSAVVRSMSPAGRGAYIALIAEAWHQTPPGSVPDNEAELADLARVSASCWKKVSAEVRRAFVRRDDGRLHQPFMSDSIAPDGYGKIEKNRAAAVARWAPKANADAMQTHSGRNAPPNAAQCHQEERRVEGEPEESRGDGRNGGGGGGFGVEVQEKGATVSLTPRQVELYRMIQPRPSWMPTGKGWLDKVTCRRLACLKTTCPLLIADALAEAKDKRNTANNPAGIVFDRLNDPDPGLLEALSAQEPA